MSRLHKLQRYGQTLILQAFPIMLAYFHLHIREKNMIFVYPICQELVLFVPYRPKERMAMNVQSVGKMKHIKLDIVKKEKKDVKKSHPLQERLKVTVSTTWVLQSHKFSSKSDQKQKKIINRTFFVNKQLTLFFNFLKEYSLNFVQNFRECLFNPTIENCFRNQQALNFLLISVSCLQHIWT